MQVPPVVQVGKTVHLACRFDLEGANLYSLNWWRGSDQFYQFSPSSPEPVIVYDSPGITVDRRDSGQEVVVLRNISHASAGRYKCEVLADYPSFEKHSETTEMKVIDVPSGPPRLALSRLQWSPGEVLRANCTFPGARPPSELHWYINGKKISPQSSLLVHPESKKGANDFVSRTSQLTLTLRSTHFTPGGQATLTCEATVPGVYRRTAKVYLSLPGYKTAAPSLKLYGTGSGLRGGATLVATCLVLLLL
ncbi:carcinoembryonic antigen-related cell adhesion molecule 6-like [Scylla paramamosain]|uniref:carcinoembryonic antigen-related cell adhesion molecule 6-like n=1 Tax=Scylla paramamosain TaxID=85552 RepID=UPI0030836FA0